MKIVLQRVKEASVRVEGEVVGRIGTGLLLLVGLGEQDSEAQLLPMVEKILHLRVFSNEEGKFDRSLLDVGGELLVVSQFTLFGDCRKGRRPDFAGALKPELARALYEQFIHKFSVVGSPLGLPAVQQGRFGAMMDVSSVNDGPVTLLLDNTLVA